MQKPIVVVGSINLDLVASADRLPQVGETVRGTTFNSYCGGKGANQAVAVAKLGNPVFLVGNVGSDIFATQLREGLEQAGVDMTHVAAVDGPSGIASITTAQRGENTIVIVPGANDQLTPQALEKTSSVLNRAGILMAQLEIPLETVEYLAWFAEENNIPLMLDPAPSRELPASLLRRVTWLTPNETETEDLLSKDVTNGDNRFDSAAERILELGARNVLLKLGSRGCIVAQRGLAQKTIPAFSVDAVDTTAAGDAFNAGFAVGILRGYKVEECAVFASAVAAISVTRPGAQPSMPTYTEVEQFLSKHRGFTLHPATLDNSSSGNN